MTTFRLPAVVYARAHPPNLTRRHARQRAELVRLALRAQVSDLLAYADDLRLDVVRIVTEVSRPGTPLEHRHSLDYAVGLVEAGEAEVLLVGSLGQLTHSLATYRELQRRGVRVGAGTLVVRALESLRSER